MSMRSTSPPSLRSAVMYESGLSNVSMGPTNESRSSSFARAPA
jgi:hypothetical protein